MASTTVRRRLLRRFATVALALYVAHTLLLAVGSVTGLWRSSYLAADNGGALAVQFGLAGASWILLRRPDRPAAVVVLVAASSATAVLLGLAASWRCTSGTAPGWAALLDTMGLFLGGGDAPFGESPTCPGPPPLAWQAAQIAALLAVGLGALGIIAVLFRTQLDRLAARVARSVVVVTSPTAELDDALASIRARYPSRVRVITLDDRRAAARTRGVSVLEADPTDAEQLAPLVRRRGRSVLRAVHLLGDSSARNEAILSAFAAVESGSRPRIGGPPLAQVRIDDVWQAEYWRRARVGRREVFAGDAFSLQEATAGDILDHLVALDCDLVIAAGDRALSVALITEVARRGREDAARRGAARAVLPAIVLVGPGTDEIVETQTALQERFGNSSPPVRSTDEPVTTGSVLGLVGTAVTPALLLLDSSSADAASGFAAAHPGLIVLARDDRSPGVVAAPEMERLHLFGTTSAPAATVWERIAEIAHSNYLHDHGLDPARPARRPWAELDDFHRESNLRLITTTLASAAVIGRTWGPSSSSDVSEEFAPSEIEIAARLEHDSWMRHHLAAGWRRGAVFDTARRVHPMLRSWDELDEADRPRARGSVRDALALLAVAGYHPRPDVQPWREFVRRGGVSAVRESAPWEWTSDGGAVLTAEAGDWRVRDGVREWSVRDAEFRATYEPGDSGDWIRSGTVRARRAIAGESIDTIEGPVTAGGEDAWVVRGPGGDEWLAPGDHFSAAYSPTATF